jgi:hypothetical protein
LFGSDDLGDEGYDYEEYEDAGMDQEAIITAHIKASGRTSVDAFGATSLGSGSLGTGAGSGLNGRRGSKDHVMLNKASLSGFPNLARLSSAMSGSSSTLNNSNGSGDESSKKSPNLSTSRSRSSSGLRLNPFAIPENVEPVTTSATGQAKSPFLAEDEVPDPLPQSSNSPTQSQQIQQQNQKTSTSDPMPTQTLQTEQTYYDPDADLELEMDYIMKLFEESLERLPTEMQQRYQFVGLLGYGGNGFVADALDLLEPKEVAIKFVRKSRLPEESLVYSDAFKTKVPLEAEILRELNHTSVITFYNLYQCEQYVYIAMEKAKKLTWKFGVVEKGSDGQGPEEKPAATTSPLPSSEEYNIPVSTSTISNRKYSSHSNNSNANCLSPQNPQTPTGSMHVRTYSNAGSTKSSKYSSMTSSSRPRMQTTTTPSGNLAPTGLGIDSALLPPPSTPLSPFVPLGDFNPAGTTDWQESLARRRYGSTAVTPSQSSTPLMSPGILPTPPIMIDSSAFPFDQTSKMGAKGTSGELDFLEGVEGSNSPPLTPIEDPFATIHTIRSSAATTPKPAELTTTTIVDDTKLVRRKQSSASARTHTPTPSITKLVAATNEPTSPTLTINKTHHPLARPRHSHPGDLYDFLCMYGITPKIVQKHLFRQLVSAYQCIRKHGYVYLDFRGENILIDDDLNLKMVDFGMAQMQLKIRNENEESLNPAASEDLFLHYGTREASAPEILLGNGYEGPEADIWAMGLLLFLIATGGEEAFVCEEAALEGRIPWPEDNNEGRGMDDDCKELIGRMLDVDPKKRATIDEVAGHRWLNA